MKQGVSNFFSNDKVVNTLLNDLFQLKLGAALEDSQRLLINTTLGIGGLFDVASRFGIPYNSEDLGQTLAVWGLNSGPYIVLPLLGPSNLRDAVGRISDWYVSPLSSIRPNSVSRSALALDKVNQRSRVLPLDDLIAGDPFLFTREAYRQQREWEIADGKNEAFDLEFSTFE